MSLTHQVNCPKCNGDLTDKYPTYPSKIKPWCPKCEGYVSEEKCVSCNKVYYTLRDITPTFNPWHNHKCSKSYERGREAGEKLASKWEEGDLSYKRSEERRLYEGLEAMEREEDNLTDKDQWE